jgi:hypothetical protein
MAEQQGSVVKAAEARNLLLHCLCQACDYYMGDARSEHGCATCGLCWTLLHVLAEIKNMLLRRWHWEHTRANFIAWHEHPPVCDKCREFAAAGSSSSSADASTGNARLWGIFDALQQ